MSFYNVDIFNEQRHNNVHLIFQQKELGREGGVRAQHRQPPGYYGTAEESQAVISDGGPQFSDEADSEEDVLTTRKVPQRKSRQTASSHEVYISK